MVIKAVSAAIAVVILSGCSTPEKEYIVKTVEVKVPVITECPKPEIRDLPVLPISNLKSTSGNDETVKAYSATVEILKTEVKWYRRMLFGE